MAHLVCASPNSIAPDPDTVVEERLASVRPFAIWVCDPALELVGIELVDRIHDLRMHTVLVCEPGPEIVRALLEQLAMGRIGREVVFFLWVFFQVK